MKNDLDTPVIIYGAGSMARCLRSFLTNSCIPVVGFISDDDHSGPFLDGVKVFNSNTYNLNFLSDDCNYIVAFGFHGMNRIRRNRFDDLKKRGFKIGHYIHPSLLIHSGVQFGEGVVIYDQTSIHPNTVIGDNVFISSNVNIGHDCQVGESSWINSGVSLGGGVKLGKGCVLGMNSCVAHGITLGDEVFVGANTLVTQNLPSGSVIVSNSGEILDIPSERFLKALKVI